MMFNKDDKKREMIKSHHHRRRKSRFVVLLLRAHKNRRERETRYLDLIFLVVVQRADGRAGFRLAASFLAAAFLRTLVRGHDERLEVFFLRSSFVFVEKKREEKKGGGGGLFFASFFFAFFLLLL